MDIVVVDRTEPIEDDEVHNNGEVTGVTKREGADGPDGADGGKGAPDTDVHTLIFPVDSSPPLYISIAYALQQLFTTIPGCVTMVVLLSSYICASPSPQFAPMVSTLMSTTLFMAGIATWLQTTMGVRLPIVQGSSFSYISPIVAMMSIEKWKCVVQSDQVSGYYRNHINIRYSNVFNPTSLPLVETEDNILERISELSGGFIMASGFQVALGSLGLVGVAMRYIGPLTIIPTVSMIGISMAEAVTEKCETSWTVSAIGVGLICFFSLYLNKVFIPVPTYNTTTGFQFKRFPIFQLLSPLISTGLVWLLCYILTVTEYFPDDPESKSYTARTNNNMEVISKVNWFTIPYPGQFGWPTFGAGAFAGFLASTFASIIESVGDYYATARICSLPPPPRHAFNRGVMSEGLSSFVGGFMGLCHGTTSYSQVIGFIGITGNGSRQTWQIIGFILMLCGLFGKFGAFLTLVPSPVIGSTMVVGLGMLVSVALLNVTKIDLRMPRNMIALGTSIMLALMLPKWSVNNPDALNTGNVEISQVLKVLIRTPMFVGGAFGFFFDNIFPGDRKCRGLTPDPTTSSTDTSGTTDKQDGQTVTEYIYDVMRVGKYFSTRDPGVLKWVPFLPMFDVRPARLEDEERGGGVSRATVAPTGGEQLELR